MTMASLELLPISAPNPIQTAPQQLPNRGLLNTKTEG
jgi:hypothetical protein